MGLKPSAFERAKAAVMMAWACVNVSSVMRVNPCACDDGEKKRNLMKRLRCHYVQIQGGV
jgi:hypothetical protein